MINWINSQTDKFTCLVNHDGVFNLEAEYFNTEELWFPEWEFHGTPWDVKQKVKNGEMEENLYEKYSPHNYCQNMNTPTLVIHGGKDYRVCETESLSLFTVLQRRGVPSKFLFFPDENHWCLKPRNWKKWQSTINDWLDTWLNNNNNGGEEEEKST